MKYLRTLASRLFRRIISWRGYALVPKGLGYFCAEDVVPKARRANLSVCEYLEQANLNGVGKRRDLIISALKSYLPAELPRIVEIGPGTGMYLEKIIENHGTQACEVYETNAGWVNYLAETYSSKTRLICRNADGKTLEQTTAKSADAAFAHGVFVYLPLMTVFRYLEEMVRVVKPGGWIVFDCFLTRDFDVRILKEWQEHSYSGDFPMVISEHLLQEIIEKYGLSLMGNFETPYHASKTTYFVLRKNPSGQ